MADKNSPKHDAIVIRGVHKDGAAMRPADWSDRIASLAAEYGPDRRLRYSKQLRTTTIEGQKCLLLDARLKETNESLYEMVICFAEENRLQISGDVAAQAASQTCSLEPDTTPSGSKDPEGND